MVRLWLNQELLVKLKVNASDLEVYHITVWLIKVKALLCSWLTSLSVIITYFCNCSNLISNQRFANKLVNFLINSIRDSQTEHINWPLYTVYVTETHSAHSVYYLFHMIWPLANNYIHYRQQQQHWLSIQVP